jgi:hypothetical protein
MTRAQRVAAAVATLAVLLLAATDAVPLLRGPAPYPPEWRWELRAEATALGRWAWPLACATALGGLLALSDRPWFRERPRRGAAALLLGATVLGTLFQLGLLNPEPPGAIRTLLNRVSSRTDTGYFTVAASEEARDPFLFLDRHAELLLDLRRGAKHAATHPPGPVLYYRAWIAACQASPALTRIATAALDLRTRERSRTGEETLAPIAGALLGGLFVLALGAAGCVPIAGLLRALGSDPLDAARIAALWPLVPGAALMSPQFDQALAFFVAAATALLAGALVTEGPGRRRLAAAGAGLAAFAASFLSYGAVAFVGIGALAVVSALGWRRALEPVGVACVSALALLGLTVALGHEPFAAARTALAFHREHYTAPRSYALWLAFNPVDFALFLGAPLAAIGLTRIARPPANAPERYRLAIAAGLLALLASGSIRGEVGRIGVPLMALALPGALGDRGLGARDAAALMVMAAALDVVLRAFWILP